MPMHDDLKSLKAIVAGLDAIESSRALVVRPKTEVGYCKPPVATQWKPGQSGNSKGRPKLKTLAETFREVAAAPAPISDENGNPTDASRLSLVIGKLFERAVIEGKPDAAAMIIKLAREFIPVGSGSDDGSETSISPSDNP